MPVSRTRQPVQMVGLNPVWVNKGVISAVTGGIDQSTQRLGTINSAASSSFNANGVGFTNANGTAGGIQFPFPDGLSGSSDISIAVLCRVSSYPGGSTATYCSMAYNTTWTSPYAVVLFRATGGTNLSLGTCTSSSFEEVSCSPSFAPTVGWHLIGVSRSGSSVTFYFDGKAVGTATATKTPDYSKKRAINWFGSPLLSANEGPIGDFSLGILANRALMGDDFLSLAKNPWQVFSPINIGMTFYSQTILSSNRKGPGIIGYRTISGISMTTSKSGHP